MLFAAFVSTLFALNSSADEAHSPTNHAGFRRFAEGEYLTRKGGHQAAPTNGVAAYGFARACFELAEFSTNTVERATLAEQGIAACRNAIKRDTNSAPARLYLAMNLGQLARTKKLGALAIVDEMEMQFQTARRLDEHFEHAAPDRYLGLLYREAPVIVSVGDRTKARHHLLRAVKLAPEFPVNRLNLVESYMLWGEKPEARLQLKRFEALLPPARTNFSGTISAAEWADWEQRATQARNTLRN